MSEKINYEQLQEHLAVTEGLQESLFSFVPDAIRFTPFEGEEMSSPSYKAPYYRGLRVNLGDETFQITSGALIEAFGLIGLKEKYVTTTPMEMLLPHLDFWFANKGGEYKALSKDGVIISFCRPGTEIYSTQEVLDAILGNTFDTQQMFFVNLSHSIEQTHFCAVSERPEHTFADGPETVLGGFVFQTSILGTKPLNASAYLHRPHTDSGSMSSEFVYQWDRNIDKRRYAADGTENVNLPTAYTWAEDIGPYLEQNMSAEFRKLVRLKQHNLGSHITEFLGDVFSKHKVPAKYQAPILETFAEQPTETMYDLWTSIGYVANHGEDIDARKNRLLLETTGALVAHPDRCGECQRVVDAPTRTLSHA